MEVQEKLEQQGVKCSSLHSALILRKELAHGKGLTPTQQRGRLQGWCGVPKKYPGISKPLAQATDK